MGPDGYALAVPIAAMTPENFGRSRTATEPGSLDLVLDMAETGAEDEGPSSQVNATF